MRVAINLLTDDPDNPSGAHWFWTRIIPEMGRMLTDDEEFHLLVSRRSRPTHQGYGPKINYITFPWSNESPPKRTLSEHLYAPLRLPLSKIDVFSTLLAPIVRPAPSLVVHIKTMHAHTAPQALRPSARLYRQLSYPRTVRVADAVIINSESLRREVNEYLKVDPAKLHLIPEAVDHDVFRPGDRDEAMRHVARYGVTKPFVLFVSSLWRYKNCGGLLRAFAAAKADLGDRQLVVVGPDRDLAYVTELRALADELGIGPDVVWVGGVPLEETVQFYRSADVFVYPSFNETFGLPILEAMASACPVVTSDVTAMPETAGGAAVLADPADPESIADAIVKACGPENDRLRAAGPERAGQFTWAATAERTLAVYREVHARRQAKGSHR
jgi:glycosyltransferase involved in cell wall biosynthesis